MAIGYRQEFFDRQYTARECYSRAWKYMRPYRVRIFIGLFCGMLTAGTMLPVFQAVRPVLEKARANDIVAVLQEDAQTDGTASAVRPEKVPSRTQSAIDRKIAKASHLPSWYPAAEKVARRLGISLQGENGAMGGVLLVVACVVIPLVAVLRLFLTFLNHYCLVWASGRAVIDLRVDVLAHIQKQSLQFHGLINVGQLMSRANTDPRVLGHIISGMLAELARAPFEILLAVGFIVWYAVENSMLPTLVVIFVAMPLFMFPVRSLGRRIREWSRRALEKGSATTSNVHELLTCIRVIKAYDTESFEIEKYRTSTRQLLWARMKAFRWGLWVSPTVETIGIILLCGFLVWCFLMQVTLTDIVPMIAPLVVIYKPVKALSKLQVSIENAQVSLQRLWSILDVDMELPERPDARRKRRFADRIAFEGVSFRYTGADSDAVRHASFEIPRGSMVAVVGSTGSGKTTMSALLARFYDPTAGRVTIDGVDVRDLKISDVRRLVGSVQQETLLFNDSIEDNIRYGSPNATHDEVVAAAKLANAHDFIMSQPEGYDRLVGEKGFALSGGERQRIAIARAILRNPPILILDEATSALDTVTERMVQHALNNLMKNRTVFAIAHRLSTVRNADLILVMENGEIVERGTHEELLARNGVYSRLCSMQDED